MVDMLPIMNQTLGGQVDGGWVGRFDDNIRLIRMENC